MKKGVINQLEKWYLKNHRELPWRKKKNAYLIWLSEIMSQQTTIASLLPIFDRFTKAFPNLKALASAKESQVLKQWAGLGYYSRARNLLKSAQIMDKEGVPKTYEGWLDLPGVGPYTAAAIASSAFGVKVGALDGNAIRVLSRYYNKSVEWWTTTGKKELQEKSDLIAQGGNPAIINQAVMELGSSLCRPTSPQCSLCPVQKTCEGYVQGSHESLPLKKKKVEKEILLWQPEIYENSKKEVGLSSNNYAPFLKNLLLPPGRVKSLKTPPKTFAFSHSITKYKIYVKPQVLRSSPKQKLEWYKRSQIGEVNPTSLLQKTLAWIETA